MKNKLIGGLIAFNLALAAMFVYLAVPTQPVQGQGAFGAQASNLMMIPGRVRGQQGESVFIYDLNRGVVVVIGLQNRTKLKAVGGRNFKRDFQKLTQEAGR